MASTVAVASPNTDSATELDIRIPGEVGIWVFILGDMLAFAAFFGAFIYQRGGEPAVFETGRQSLETAFAVANTVLLLTSSLFVAMAIRGARVGAKAVVPKLITWAGLCGLGFVINKGIEWAIKLHDGVTPATNHFYMYFFMLTGIHLAHVLIGLVTLAILWGIARRSVPKPSDLMVLEIGASYWHMVDLLWVVLFPLLYLVR